MLSEMLSFPKLQFLLSNLISTYLPVKSKFKLVSSFAAIEGNNIDISARFPPASVPHISKTFLKNFLLYNFEPVRLNDVVFTRSSICLWCLLMTSSNFLAFSGWKVWCCVAQSARNGWSLSIVLQPVLGNGTFTERLDTQTYYCRHHFADLLIWHKAVAYPGILFGGGSISSVEDRGQRERGSGGGSPLVRGSGGSCNLVQ